jgi:hypothetical protein
MVRVSVLILVKMTFGSEQDQPVVIPDTITIAVTTREKRRLQ